MRGWLDILLWVCTLHRHVNKYWIEWRLLLVVCVLAALYGSTCSVGFEIGKHTEGTMSSEHAMCKCFGTHEHICVLTTRHTRDGSWGVCLPVLHTAVWVWVLGPANCSNAHTHGDEAQSCVSEPEQKILFSACFKESKIYSVQQRRDLTPLRFE